MRLPVMTEVRNAFAPENLASLSIDANLPVVAVVIPSVGELSRKERDDLRTLYPAKLALQGIKVFDDSKPAWKKSFPEAMPKIRQSSGAGENDYIVLVAAGIAAEGTQSAQPPKTEKSLSVVTGREREVYEGAGQVRLALGQKFADRHGCFNKRDYRFLWVTDFPMFEWGEEEQRWNAAHHPFTSPHEDDMDKLESDPGAVRALAYDIVLNGTELGSGSIRIHHQDIQSIIFKALGMSKEEQQARFGFFLEALQYGTPPHGGIALGLDRIVMILAGADSLREVDSLPQDGEGHRHDDETLRPRSAAKQLKELSIAVVARKDI